MMLSRAKELNLFCYYYLTSSFMADDNIYPIFKPQESYKLIYFSHKTDKDLYINFLYLQQFWFIFAYIKIHLSTSKQCFVYKKLSCITSIPLLHLPNFLSVQYLLVITHFLFRMPDLFNKLLCKLAEANYTKDEHKGMKFMQIR